MGAAMVRDPDHCGLKAQPSRRDKRRRPRQAGVGSRSTRPRSWAGGDASQSFRIWCTSHTCRGPASQPLASHAVQPTQGTVSVAVPKDKRVNTSIQNALVEASGRLSFRGVPSGTSESGEWATVSAQRLAAVSGANLQVSRWLTDAGVVKLKQSQIDDSAVVELYWDDQRPSEQTSTDQ
jgi:hypothetical protein